MTHHESVQGTTPQKLCPVCDTVKPLTEYYKAGNYLQTLCKVCHNIKRCAHHSNNYIKTNKPKGFLALPTEEQQKIMDMLSRGLTRAAIANAYKNTEYKKVSATNLCIWNKKGYFTAREDASSNIPAVL
jgi:hypothetical protein